MRIKANKKAPARGNAEEEYLLSTKLFCGKCQRMMAGDGKDLEFNHEMLFHVKKCKGAKISGVNLK